MENGVTMRLMEQEPPPLELLASLLEKNARQGPRRHAAVHNEDVEIRIAAMRVFEDLDRRLRALEESHDGDS